MTNLALNQETNNTLSPKNQTFVNLHAASIAADQKERNEFLKDLHAQTEVKAILAQWYYDNLIPVSSKNRTWPDVETLKNYLINRYNKKRDAQLQKELTRIQTIYNAADFDGITITVEWKRSQIWGNNPNAEAKECYKPGGCKYFQSGSIGGCGYDKESTAVANALNQCNTLLKLLYAAKDKAIENDPTVKNHALFGYGSGYWLLPQVEDGVGTSCYYKIMESIGLKFDKTASGKTFDVYTITK